MQPNWVKAGSTCLSLQGLFLDPLLVIDKHFRRVCVNSLSFLQPPNPKCGLLISTKNYKVVWKWNCINYHNYHYPFGFNNYTVCQKWNSGKFGNLLGLWNGPVIYNDNVMLDWTSCVLGGGHCLLHRPVKRWSLQWPPPPPTICMFPLRSRLSTDCRTAEPCWVCFWIWRPSCTLIPRLQHQSGQQEASWSCGGGAPAGKQSERCNAAERSGTAGSGACRARPSSVDKKNSPW